jgi:epoxyqueuosine reductase QueG
MMFGRWHVCDRHGHLRSTGSPRLADQPSETYHRVLSASTDGVEYDRAMDEQTVDELEATTLALKQLGLNSGATVVGVASASAFNEYVPEGHRPSDFMPGAKSVVVAGSLGPSNAAWQSPNRRLMEITGYDFRENVASLVMAEHIETVHGYQAMQAPALPTSGQHPPMSMMLAAVLAGLGTRSIAANIILHPTYGLLYYAAAITTMPLVPDHQLEDNVCPARSCVKMYELEGKTPCMAVCPADDGGCIDATIDDGEITSSYFNRERCSTRAMNFGIRGHIKQVELLTAADDIDEAKAVLYSDDFRRNLSSVGRYKESVAQCFECMRVCPVGRYRRKLK